MVFGVEEEVRHANAPRGVSVGLPARHDACRAHGLRLDLERNSETV